MRTLLYVLLVACCPSILWGQNIVQGEYFFNTDPGTGQAISIAIASPDSMVQVETTLPLDGTLAEGFNTVFFRFRNNTGQWSHTSSRVFYQQNTLPNTPTIEQAEYFINDDPGPGMGTEVPLAGGSDSLALNFTVDLTGLSPGFHRLYLRAKNQQGHWSITSKRLFYVKEKEDNQLTNITEVKYFFTDGTFFSDTLSYPIASPQASVNLEFVADISSLPPDQYYDMYIIAVNEDGLEGMVEKRSIKACSTDPAIADFGSISFGNTVSFVDSSQFTSRYFWDFGDGQTDTVSNPVHIFDNFGTYTVTLIAEGFCKNDTISKELSIAGLTDIYANVGGNNGDVSLAVYGGGFNASTDIFLSNDATTIQPDTLILIDDNRAHLRFDLRDEDPGVFDVSLQQAGTQDTLQQAFTIQEEEDQQRFSLDITGRTTIRRGRSSPVTFSVTNNSPVDGIALPLFILLKGDTTIQMEFDFDWVEPANDTIDYGSILPYLISDSLYGQPQEVIIIPLIIPYILAGQTEEITINLTAENDFEIEAWVGETMYNSPIGDNIVGCANGFVSVLTGLLTAGNPVSSCLTSVVDNGFAIFRTMHEQANGLKEKASKAGSVLWSLTKVVTGCVDLLPAAKAAKLAQSTIGILLDAARVGELIETYDNIVNKCSRVFFGRRETKKVRQIRVVNSLDPNEKAGPSNVTADNYTNGAGPFDYVIYFENVDTATAAAQEVFIIDTLDLQVLDITTFSLGPIAFSDQYTITPPPGLTEYTDLVDLRPDLDLIVRVDGQLDTLTGIVNWRFLSLDPASLELTSDPLLGFLPPNNMPGEGEGQVSFSIRPKAALTTGTVIDNQASIIFDLNEAILTNVHLNTLDKILPSSAVNDLDAIQSDTLFTVSWSGDDTHAGIRAYDIYLSTNNGPFDLWRHDLTGTSATFQGSRDSTYGFYSIAKDWAGNQEGGKSEAEASTLVTSLRPPLTGGLKDEQLRIFPNPSNCCFTLSFLHMPSLHYQLYLTDLSGSKLLEQSVDRNDYVLDLSEFPKGMYILQVRTEEGVIYRELILQ